MVVSYARTIHKFQGLSAGPVDKGKIPNMFMCIICDPGLNSDEKSALGMFYTSLSRATTFGDSNGDDSAICFDGPDFKEERFRRLGKHKGSDLEFKKVIARNKWIEILDQHQVQPLSPQHQADILAWAETCRCSADTLQQRIDACTSQWNPQH